ncbi:MAG: PfkB family carbohydrate kinase, partial [Bacilli bacterium]|nr:PfkB family carbohydrate kinase [Bacilli bacterium]
MERSILIIGSLNIDYSIYVEKFSRPGETIKAKKFKVSYGGKGANQAIACDKVGGNAFFFGALGSDENGKSYKRYLKSNKLKHRVKKTSGTTGVAFIEINEIGENRISIVQGANYLITKQDVDRIFNKSNFKYIILQNEIPVDITTYIINKSFNQKRIVIFNPAPVVNIPLNVISKVTYLIVNETELEDYLNIFDCKTIKELLAKTKIPHIISTKGVEGVSYDNHSRHLDISSRKVVAIDSVGA